jgi:hypothetical protein
MRLDSFLQALVPRDDKFHRLFKQDADNLLQAAQIFRDLMKDEIGRDERAQKIKRVEELEHKGDEISHLIFSELSSSFLTPFDREDIHALASSLDDILDSLQGAAGRITLYKVKKINPPEERLAELIHDQVVQLHRAIGHLAELRNSPDIRESLVRVNSIENEADDLFERAIADLFENCDDPIKLIKSKELLVSLELATDQCEDAANVIESIMVKNA